MTLAALEKTVREHGGEFLCEQIHKSERTKVVHFVHVVEPPSPAGDLPEFGRLREFYETFGSILFYHDAKTGDAGKYLASPTEWPELQEGFGLWLEGLEEEERLDYVPEWVEKCLVIGETPRSGNYILVPTAGAEAGFIFEFEHDGFEFNQEANDIVEYVGKLLKPDARVLTELASHMRFVEGDPLCQWWIRELKDNRGHVVSTQA